MNQRLGVYRKIAAARSEDELDREVDEVRDRYGPLPVTRGESGHLRRIRVLADRLRVETIDREGHAVVLKFRQDASVDPVRLVNLLKKRPDVQMLPPAVLRLDLKHTGGRDHGALLTGGGRRPGVAPTTAPGTGGRGARTGSGAGGGKLGRSTEKPASVVVDQAGDGGSGSWFHERESDPSGGGRPARAGWAVRPSARPADGTE